MSDAVQHQAFRTRRDETVRAPQGALALALTHWVIEPGQIDGIPGVWAPTASGEGIAVTANAADDIQVDGQAVDGTVIVRPVSASTPSRIRFDDARTGYVIEGDSGFALRVWDADAAERRGFLKLDAYDFAPEWVLSGTFEPVAGGVDFTYGKSQGGDDRTGRSPGIVRFEHDGQQLELLALPDGESLQIVLADATTGVDTYGVGRFLFVHPAADGTVALDFNRLVVPPCSMSDQFNCPLPPAQNRLSFAIEAGEKGPVFADTASRGAHASA